MTSRQFPSPSLLCRSKNVLPCQGLQLECAGHAGLVKIKRRISNTCRDCPASTTVETVYITSQHRRRRMCGRHKTVGRLKLEDRTLSWVVRLILGSKGKKASCGDGWREGVRVRRGAEAQRSEGLLAHHARQGVRRHGVHGGAPRRRRGPAGVHRQGRDGRFRGHRPQQVGQGDDAAVLHRGGRRRHHHRQARRRLHRQRQGSGSQAWRQHHGRLAHGAAARRAAPAGGHGLRAPELCQDQNRVVEKKKTDAVADSVRGLLEVSASK